jgi:HEAT repeats
MRTLVAAILSAGCILAQQPQVENARFETRAFSGSLASQVSSLSTGPLWAAWSEPITPGQHGDMCGNEHAAGTPVRLEGPTSLVVLVRVENRQVDRIRVASLDCRFDGGGLPFYWLTGVPAAESVNWLKAQIAGSHADSAIFALSQMSDPAGIAAVMDAAKNDKNPRVRSKALFWLAQKAANKEAQAVIGNAVLNDPDRAVKEQAVFALQQLPEGQGVPLLINVAKNNPDPAVRRKAMFWLGQSKDPRALDFFAQVLKP